jgi:hypothetical protein
MLRATSFKGGAAVIMAPKRKTAAARLREQVERVRNYRQLHNLIRRADPDWTDDGVRGAYACAVLTLEGEPGHSPLRKAFQKFELDPIDPFNWRLLLARLAAIFFAPVPTRPRGARPKWDEPRRMLLKTDAARARKRLKESAKGLGYPPPTDDDVAAYLRRMWPDRYPMDEASIRKYIVSGPPKGRR